MKNINLLKWTVQTHNSLHLKQLKCYELFFFFFFFHKLALETSLYVQDFNEHGFNPEWVRNFFLTIKTK